jgi:hypothetical protein
MEQLGYFGDVVELGAHRLGAADGAADDGLVQHGPVLGRVLAGEAFLAGQADLDDLTARIFRALTSASTCTRSSAPTSRSQGHARFAARSLGEVARQISDHEHQDPPAPHPGPAGSG